MFLVVAKYPLQGRFRFLERNDALNPPQDTPTPTRYHSCVPKKVYSVYVCDADDNLHNELEDTSGGESDDSDSEAPLITPANVRIQTKTSSYIL
jgi:hypothetical protein